jgi:ketol-acid reductoisomerase
MAEVAAGTPNLLAARRAVADHDIEKVGRDLRDMMPFLVAKTPEDDQ